MNDQDRALVEQVLQAAGTAGQRGFSMMVRYQWASGVTDVIGSVMLIAAIGLAFCLAWRASAKIEEVGDRAFSRLVAGTIGGGIIIMTLTMGLMEGAVKMLAPEGAAIHSAMHR